MKHTRDSLGAKEIGEQLAIDIQRYQSRTKDADSILFFIYDPAARIANPVELENSLGGSKSGLNVKVMIRPRL